MRAEAEIAIHTAAQYLVLTSFNSCWPNKARLHRFDGSSKECGISKRNPRAALPSGCR